MAVLLTAASAAADMPVRFLEPAAGTTLEPGSEVTVQWTPLPEGTREFELLLRLGGHGRTVRLTECMDPTRTSFRWTVPSLPARDARLLLRLSRGRGEETAAVGPAIRIGGRMRTTLSGVAYTRGEWWLAAAAPAVPEPPPPEPAGVHRTAAPPMPLEPFGAAGEREHAEPAENRAPGAAASSSGSVPATRASEGPGRKPRTVPQRE